MIKVFISYVREDIDRADRIYSRLKSIPTLDIWFDRRCLKPGEKWRLAISKAIRESSFFITLLSKRSISKRGFAQKEVKYALEILDELPEDQIFIIPLRLDDCYIPERLRELHCIDLFPIEDEAMEKVLDVLKGHEYLGRIGRSKHIIRSVENFIEECNKNKEAVYIRMRATFGSMSNIIHYGNKKIPDLNLEQKKELDELLIKERNCIINLLNMDNVKLKCILWPRLQFLKYYSDEEKRERAELLKAFLNSSIEKYTASRQILFDEAGTYGNLIIVSNNQAIVSNPQSGGFRETSVFKDSQTLYVLTREYDNLFERIWKGKLDFRKYKTEEERNRGMMFDALNLLEQELKSL
jgi:hypothetical protein